MNIKSLLSLGKEEGWHVREDYIEEHLEESFNNIHALNKHLLNQDLKEIGLASLSSDLIKGKYNQLNTPIILQVSNVRNISAPKANEESAAAPRLLKITFTDGISYIHGIEIQPIKCLSLKTAPGTKVKLVANVPVIGGFLLLSTANIQLLGGEVEDLYKKWQMSQSASKYSRSTISTDGSGPPSWVPFGHKILVRKENNFRALSNDHSTEKDDEFESQRKQVVQEISQGSSQKIFGGGKQMLDSNVQKVVNAGFTIQEAEWSLRRNKNDAYRAIQDLRGNCGVNSNEGAPKPPEELNRKGVQRGRGKTGRGRGRGGPDDSDEEDYVALSSSSRPSGPASLLDYLESKILDKKDQTNSSYNEYGNKSKQYARGREGGNFGKRGSKNERGKPYAKNQSESIMSENWPSLQKNSEPEPIPNRDVSPNIYGRDDEENVSLIYHEASYKDNKLKNRSLNRGNESQNYRHNSVKENMTRYGRGNFVENPKNFLDKNYQNRVNPEKYDGWKQTQEFQNYRSSNYDDKKSRYENNYQDNTFQNYQDNSYKDRKSMMHCNEDTRGRDQENHYLREYENSKPSNSYQQGYGCQSEATARYKRPDQPIFIHSRGRQQNYNRTQDYSTKTANDLTTFQMRKQEDRNLSKKEPKEHSTQERELISQFEISMVMAGCYEPSENHSHIKNSYQSNNYNYEENRPPYNDYQSSEFYGSVEYHRGRGFVQRRGSCPRYGRGSRY